MATVKRPYVAGAILAAVAAGLSGCESFDLGPAAITRVGDRLVITVCSDLVVTQIVGVAEMRSGAAKDLIDLEGNSSLHYGQELGADSLPEGLAGTFSDVSFEELEYLGVRFVGPDSDFLAGWSGTIPESGWLQTDGTVTVEACDGTT